MRKALAQVFARVLCATSSRDFLARVPQCRVRAQVLVFTNMRKYIHSCIRTVSHAQTVCATCLGESLRTKICLRESCASLAQAHTQIYNKQTYIRTYIRKHVHAQVFAQAKRPLRKSLAQALAQFPCASDLALRKFLAQASCASPCAR